MKKNGFTVVDMLIIIGVLTISALIIIPNVSNALKIQDNKEEVYQSVMANYLKSAEKYANDNKEELKENNNNLVAISDLVEKGYIISHNSNNDIIDVRDNSTKLNNVKFKLIYDEDSDTFSAELVG